MKQLFIDVETTGLDPKIHGLTQIAGMVIVDGEEKERFNFDVSPFQGQKASLEALQITGKTINEIREYPSPGKIYAALTGILGRYVDKFDKRDKLQFIAYNSPFDNQFMREFFKNNNDQFFGSFFWNPDICVMRLAFCFMADKRPGMKNFKLTTVAAELGIEFDESNAHDAMFDIDLTRQIYAKILG